MSTSLPHPEARVTALRALTGEPRLRIRAAQVVDGAGVDVAPGVILLDLDSGQILAVGRPSDAALAAGAELDLGDMVLLPGLVNAHTHLDLSHMPAAPPPRTFVEAIDRFRLARQSDPAAISRAVALGARRSLEAGVVAVGDIAGALGPNLGLAAGLALAGHSIWGMTFYEFFGIGADDAAARARLAPVEGLLGLDIAGGAGLSPHAPYSVSLEAYHAARDIATRAGAPLVTHLAESPEEAELIAEGRGSLRRFLESLGLWSDQVAARFGHGRSPVEHLAPVLGSGVACVHVNQASDRDLDLLAASGAGVIYCPRASAYYGGEAAFGPHRYREMLSRGICVALGTDSAANLPAGAIDEGGEGISVLAEMRLLHQRDGTDPGSLLRMATVNGARLIGLDDSRVRLAPGCVPLGLLALPARGRSARPLQEVLSDERQPLVLLGEKFSRRTRIV